MPALHTVLLVLVAALPYAAANAYCGAPFQGLGSSVVPHWPVLAPPTTVSAPFIVFVTNGSGTGFIGTIACSDTNCAGPLVITDQTGAQGSPSITADEGLYPCIALSGPSSLPVYGFADRTNKKYLWDACIDANCTQISRYGFGATVDLNSMSLTSIPNSVPVTSIYQTLLGDVGEVSTMTCYLSSCTILFNKQTMLNDNASAFVDPIQLASLIASDQTLVTAFIRNGNLTVAKCTDASCIGGKIVNTLPYPASKNCRIDMMLSPPPTSLPLIAFCDGDGYLRVLICDDSACNSSRQTNAPAVFVGQEPLSVSARRYGGVQLSIAMQPCPTPRPLISFSSYYSGALYTYECTDSNCTSGIIRKIIDDGVAFSDMTVFPSGHPLAGIVMIVYSRLYGTSYVLERMYCLDGRCSECSTSIPIQPTSPPSLTNLCGTTIVNPPAYPPAQSPSPSTPAPTASPTPAPTTASPTAPPIPTPTATPTVPSTSAAPQTTQPVVTGPLGPCSVTNNCGPLPTADWPLLCCDGTWIVDANATASKPNRTIQLFTNGSVFWDGDFTYKENDTCTIFIDPSRFARKRQSQEALLKVDGDAFISGPLDIVISTAPAQGSVQATVPIVQTVSQSGDISGEFQTPIPVSLTYPGNECSEGSATQVKSADGSTLSVLVSVTNKCKGGHKGLSTGAKVAIGVTVGVVGAALIVVLVILLVIKPRWAPKLDLGSRKSARHSKVDRW